MGPKGGRKRRSGVNDMPQRFENSEGLALALLESAGQAIVAIDSSGQIVLANSRTSDIFGYSREELINAPLEILLPESKRGVHRREREEYFARPRVRPMGIGMELAGRRKSGEEFPVEVSLSHIQTAQGTFAIAFLSDISQRKNLEDQLVHAQKMEAVGRLAGGVAHDFNNMLTVISGYNRMILDSLGPLDPMRGNAEEVAVAAERAAALTSQLLVFSRRHTTRPTVLEVNTVIGSIEKMLRRLIGEDIELVLKQAPEVGKIRADAGHIEQAIVNLVVNSRDAMPEGGIVTIETANVTLDATYARSHLGVQPGEFVMVAVSDTGHGMDSETRRHIFEPFFTTKPKGKGTGLGLAIVYGMVKQSGGDIWVYSEAGRGTTFKLYFPRAGGEEPEKSVEGSERRGAAESETILVVEDEDSVRNLTVKILRQLGYRVLEAENAAKAIEVAKANPGPIELLLTDVVMPGMSGKQLAEAVQPTRPDMRVLYLSGYTENAVLTQGGLNKGVHFLAKPFTRDLLALKVREVLGDK